MRTPFAGAGAQSTLASFLRALTVGTPRHFEALGALGMVIVAAVIPDRLRFYDCARPILRYRPRTRLAPDAVTRVRGSGDMAR
jgi:hypothetical protein